MMNDECGIMNRVSSRATGPELKPGVVRTMDSFRIMRATSRGRRLIFIVHLSSFIFFLAGCGGTGSHRLVNARLGSDGDASALLSQGGVSRIFAQAGARPPAWDGLLLDNRGTTRADNLRLWGFGPADPIEPFTGGFSPFSLMPGERFFCRVTAPGGNSPSMLSGAFLWQMPVDARAAGTCIEAMQYGQVEPGRGIVLRPVEGEAWVQFAVNGPFEQQSARLGWSAEPAGKVTVMVSVEAGSWGQIGSAGDTWLKPLDISAPIKGRRQFRVKFMTPRGTGEVAIGKLRIERELSTAGRFQQWAAGRNEAIVAFDAPKGALLEFKLMKTE